MNNNIKKESLDLEAMMNHLDQKAEKKKEFNSELESLNEMLNMLGVELLTVKDGLQQIENGKHELATMNENMNDWIAKSDERDCLRHNGLEARSDNRRKCQA